MKEILKNTAPVGTPEFNANRVLSALGRIGYPKRFKTTLPNVGDLDFTVHIWPAKATDVEYRLPTIGASAGQGFYFYRNERLIQIASWNGKPTMTEPHLSLARVEFHLPSKYDGVFSVNVQKTAVRPPASFWGCLEKALPCSGGGSFKDYISDARSAYKRGRKSETDFPLVPGNGLSGEIRTAYKRSLQEKPRRVRKLGVKWRKLNPDEIIVLDKETGQILLNSTYREDLCRKPRLDQPDNPLMKLLLFFILKDLFDRSNTGKGERDLLHSLNMTILKYLGGPNET